MGAKVKNASDRMFVTLACGSGDNLHAIWGILYFCSLGVIYYFLHIKAENTIFPFRSRARMRHFRPGVRKKWFYPRGGRLRPSEARVERPHENKIIFSLVYRTLFFDTTCEKLNSGHAFLLDPVQNRALRTEC